MTREAQPSVIWEGSMAELTKLEAVDNGGAATKAGFGCVDWYQYTPPAAASVSPNEVESTESLRASTAAYSLE